MFSIWLTIVGITAAFAVILIPLTALSQRENMRRIESLMERHRENLRSEDPAVVAAALTGLLARPVEIQDPASSAYVIAEAMLRERERVAEPTPQTHATPGDGSVQGEGTPPQSYGKSDEKRIVCDMKSRAQQPTGEAQMRTINPAAYEGDIVSRLRNWRGLHLAHCGLLFAEAADEIDRLRNSALAGREMVQPTLTAEEREAVTRVASA